MKPEKSTLSDQEAGTKRGGAEEGSGTGEEKAGRERAKKAGEAAAGSVFETAASGNGFSKYSGKRVSIVRNCARFAIRNHCALLVTSMSPNCCFWNGILRKSHFPKQQFRKRCPLPPPPPSLPSPSQPFPPPFRSLPLPRPAWYSFSIV